MAIIFEEHAKLEWFAPAIDGRVCRLWRQITLNAPRAWAYLEIGCRKGNRISDLFVWLNRSHTAPLHIRANKYFMRSDDANRWTLCELLHEYHTRIASLRMCEGSPSFLEGRDFPCMQHLQAMGTSLPLSWGHMPKLRSLHLANVTRAVSLDDLAPLKVLALFNGKFTLLSQHSPSLVSLMLSRVELGGAISDTLDFPSLTHLSLYNMTELKPHINAPCLITYHEYNPNTYKSFSAPVHSLVEYGLVSLDYHRPDLTEWHDFVPNISRLSIRASPPVLISILKSLSFSPHLLPALQMISVGHLWESGARCTKKEQGTIEDLVRVRSEACNLDVALYFEPEKPFHIPLFFASVSH